MRPRGAEIDRRALPVLVHPTAPPGTPEMALREFNLIASIGFMFDTSLAVARFMFDGFLDRYPNLKLIASHAGGALPYLVGRLDQCFDKMNAARTKTSTPPAAAGSDFELVLFTVKGYDTESAALALRPAVGRRTAVLTLQNGVDSGDRLGAVLGADPVVVGTTVVATTIAEPGVIDQANPMRRIELGEPSGRVTPRVESIAAALRDAGAEVRVTTNVRRAVWEKFIRLAPGSTLTSACQASIGEVRDTAEGAVLYRALVAETVAVSRALGVGLPADTVEAAMGQIQALPADMRTSMQLDYERQRWVELEEITGTVVRLGRSLGVPTPVYDIAYAVLKVRATAFGGLG